jgi:hypothetical protein
MAKYIHSKKAICLVDREPNKSQGVSLDLHAGRNKVSKDDFEKFSKTRDFEFYKKHGIIEVEKKEKSDKPKTDKKKSKD